MKYRTLLDLPPMSLNLLSGGFFILFIALGVRIAITPNLALEVANTKLVTGNSAGRLRELAQQLEQQAEVIKQREQAYDDLHSTYEQSLNRVRGFEKVKRSIQVIDELPEVENLAEIQKEISATEEILEEVKRE